MVGKDARVTLREFAIAGYRTEAPRASLAVAPRAAEHTGQAGCVLRVIAGAGQRTQPVDSGLVGAQGRLDLGEAALGWGMVRRWGSRGRA